MADQDTTNADLNGEELNEEVDLPQGEDETLDDDQQNNDAEDTGADEGQEDDSDGNETDDDDQPKFQKRFTQLKGDDPEEYLKSLEDAYANSSTEGQRLSKEVKLKDEQVAKVANFIANNPDFAEAFSKATGEDAPKVVRDPALDYAKEQMDKEYARDYSSFSELHPEMETDDTVRQAVIDELDVIAAAYERRGQRLSMADGLKKAWISLGYDNADDKDKVVSATKQAASKPNTPSKQQKPQAKQNFTEEQLKTAEKMGITAEQLAKYSK